MSNFNAEDSYGRQMSSVFTTAEGLRKRLVKLPAIQPYRDDLLDKSSTPSFENLVKSSPPGLWNYPEGQLKITKFAAYDTRPLVPQPTPSFLLMKGVELQQVFDVQSMILFEFLKHPDPYNFSRLHELVMQISRLFLKESITYACYCHKDQEDQEDACAYCGLNKLAGLHFDSASQSKSLQTDEPIHRFQRFQKNDIVIEKHTILAVSLLVEGLRLSAECSAGSFAGTYAVLLLTSLSASWLIMLSSGADRNNSKDLRKVIARHLPKQPLLRCQNLQVKDIKSRAFQQVAKRVIYSDLCAEMAGFSTTFWSLNGSSAFRIMTSNPDDIIPTRLDDSFFVEVNEGSSAMYDWEGPLAENVQTQHLLDVQLQNGSNINGLGYCIAFALLNRRIQDALTSAQERDLEHRQLKILQDHKQRGDRWLLLWAAGISDYGLSPFGRTDEDTAMGMYGQCFSGWVHALPDILTERGYAESGNIFSLLDQNDAANLCRLVTNHMRNGKWDKGWNMTVSSAMWNWFTGRHRVCTVISRSIRAFTDTDLGVSSKHSKHQDKAVNNLQQEIGLSCAKWFEQVRQYAPFPIDDGDIIKAKDFLNPDLITASGLNNPCCGSHRELLDNACAEQAGIAILCIVAAGVKDSSEGDAISEFCDTKIGHFCTATRELTLILCGCEKNVKMYHTAVFWGRVLDAGARALRYARHFTHVERASGNLVTLIEDCSICKINNKVTL